MPRRSILSAAERESLLALPDIKDDLIRHYTFSDSDLSIIRQRRGPANRLGFAVQLCYLRFPGVILGVNEPPFPSLLKLVADQLKVSIESWDEYGKREQTRREHLVELQTVFGFQPFTMSHYRQAVHTLTELAMQTDKGVVLASALIEHLRRQSVILPALSAVERASAEAITRANRHIYDALAEPLSDAHCRRLDDLLKRRDNGKTTWLAWLRQSPVKPNSRHMLEHIERLKAWQGTVTASLMLRKLGSYPRQNGLAVALRELGRIERTLFILDWLQSVELRRRVHAGLNKGEARNALARAVFFNRLGEIRDRSFEQQRFRPQPGDGRHRVVEHGLPGTGRERLARPRPSRR